MFRRMISALVFSFLQIILPSANATELSDVLSSQLSWESAPQAAQTAAVDSESHHKIMWWNIGCGHLNAKIIKEDGQDALYTNISNLAKSPQRPDILILGEYCPSMPKATKTVLKKNYKHTIALQKSNPYKSNNGIVVYSIYPLKQIAKELLDVGQSEKESNETTRTYLLIKASAPDADLFLAPLHFYNPWGKMSMTDLITQALGKENPNFRQAELHLNLLREDVDLNAEKVLAIGDFNAAKNLFLFNNMATYNLFNDSELVDRSDNEATYPTATATRFGNTYPGLHIDHTFSSELFEGKTTVLNLKGSDHYPILFSY